MFNRGGSMRLSVRWKILLPFLVIILLIGVVLLVTNTIASRRIEQEADRRLTQIGTSANELINQSSQDILLRANVAANLPQIESAAGYPELLQLSVPAVKEELGLRELSYYNADFELGDAAFYYGGPVTTRELQTSRRTEELRAALIIETLTTGQSISGVAVSPQSSQIIGVAPVFSRGEGEGQIVGVMLAAFYLDQGFIDNISDILGADIAIVRDNAVVVSTIDRESGFESLIPDELSETTGRNLTEVDGEQLRLLASPLILKEQEEATILVTQPIGELLGVQEDILSILATFAGITGLTTLIVG